MKSKAKKRVCKWDQVIFYMEDMKISAKYLVFVSNHKTMSKSRCAFYVLKQYFTAPLLRYFKRLYRNGFSYEDCIKWLNFIDKVGYFNGLL